MSPIPYPVTLLAEFGSAGAILKEVADIVRKGGLVKSSMSSHMATALWADSGRVVFTMPCDLTTAFLNSDVPDSWNEIVRLPHPSFYLDFQASCIPCALVRDDGAVVHRTVLLGAFFDKSSGGEWNPAAEIQSTAVFLDEDGVIRCGTCSVHDLVRSRPDDVPTRLYAMALLYLMDPAHEETPQTLHGNREWRASMRSRGARDPEAALPLVNHRVLGASYHLPPEAFESSPTGRKLGLRTPVRGHIRMQPCGPARTEVRATWITPHWRGAVDAPLAPARIVQVVEPETPSLTETARRQRIIEAMAKGNINAAKNQQ